MKVKTPQQPEVKPVWGRRAGSKYGAKPTEYGGVRYASKAEASRAAELDAMVKRGEILWWIGQPKFRLGCPENVYVADFLVVHDGGIHVEDVKGMETSKFKRDRKLWAVYGPCDLWVICGKKVELVRPGCVNAESESV